MLADSLRRGLAAGLVAGLLAGLFALLVGELPVREAIRLEEQAAASTVATTADDTAAADTVPVDEGGTPPVEVSRTTQQALLPVATAIVGAAMGGLFGLAWAGARRHIRDTSEWRASWKLAAAAWVAVAFVPFLVSPANPPAVGDPATIGERSWVYVAAVVVGVLGAVVLWRLAHLLRGRELSDPVRQTILGVAGVALLAVVLVTVPASTDPIEIPPKLLWEFRLASMGTQLLLWVGIGAVNGWLWQRARTALDTATVPSPA